MTDTRLQVMTKGEENLLREALKVCPDVSIVDVVHLIFLRQAELEQEPE